jgi:alkylation response protein AidB-like acyl-CoA dehydrogenase
MTDVVEEFREFVAVHKPLHARRWGDPMSWPARRDWQRMLDTGRWAAPGWPVEYGGRGLEPHEVFTVVEVLAENGFGLLPGVLGLNYIGPTLITYGTPDQKAAYLAAILNGEQIWCQGFSEPDAGSDLASLRTSAVCDGDVFVVNGQKTWISQGMVATHMELLARTEPSRPRHKGISALLVEMDAPGIDRRPIRQIDGGAEFAEVFFTDVRVPVRNLLGPENEGWRVSMTTLGHERSASASLTRRLTIETAAWVADARETSLSAVDQDALIRSYVDAAVVAALGEEVIAQLAAGGEPGAGQSVIKLMYSEVKQRSSALRLTLADVEGVSGRRPSAGQEYLADRKTTIAGGTTQVLKNILAERVLGLPKE